MVHKELPQAWWFDSHNRAKPSRWLSSTLSELDGKTKQMLDLIEQDADSFAQRAEMYYKERPVLVDMLGDLYRAHRSLAEQCDLLLRHGARARHAHTTAFGPSSCTPQSLSRVPVGGGGGRTTPGSSCSASTCDSESEVDDPDQEQHENEKEEEEARVERMRAEMERLKEQNAALRKAADENAALKAELAAKDEEKREVIRQLASSFVTLREENRTLRGRVRESKSSSSSSSSSFRAFDLKKVAKSLFSGRLFTAHCRPPTGPIVAL